jgi:peptidoglycan hydrolase CwlO-like protein
MGLGVNMGKVLSVYSENQWLKKKNAQYIEEIKKLKAKIAQLEQVNKQIGLWNQ